jgi:hypothetical protein
MLVTKGAESPPFPAEAVAMVGFLKLLSIVDGQAYNK